jgi:hypothetical protein
MHVEMPFRIDESVQDYAKSLQALKMLAEQKVHLFI